jgi:hypothetical protein
MEGRRMKMEFEQSLVEAAVRIAIRRDPELERAFHREVDPIYRIESAEARDSAFTRVFGEGFLALGLDEPLLRLIKERPRIGIQCTLCIVRDAGRRSAESAELFVRKAGDGSSVRTLMIQVLAETLLSLSDSPGWLRRELLHVDDMLSGDFGFRAEDLAALSREDSLIRDRYRILWDVTVETRLVAEGLADSKEVLRLRPLFDRAFTVRGRPPAPGLLDAARQLDGVTHDTLLHLARRPEVLAGASAGDGHQDATRCALCGCTTYDWFEDSVVDAGRLTAAVRRARPDWAPGTAACRQCMETYAGFAAVEVSN